VPSCGISTLGFALRLERGGWVLASCWVPALMSRDGELIPDIPWRGLDCGAAMVKRAKPFHCQKNKPNEPPARRPANFELHTEYVKASAAHLSPAHQGASIPELIHVKSGSTYRGI